MTIPAIVYDILANGVVSSLSETNVLGPLQLHARSGISVGVALQAVPSKYPALFLCRYSSSCVLAKSIGYQARAVCNYEYARFDKITLFHLQPPQILLLLLLPPLFISSCLLFIPDILANPISKSTRSETNKISKSDERYANQRESPQPFYPRRQVEIANIFAPASYRKLSASSS